MRMNCLNRKILSVIGIALLALTMAEPSSSILPPDSTSTQEVQPALPPFTPQLLFQATPGSPRVNQPLRVDITLQWSEGGPFAARVAGWGQIEGLEPTEQGERQVRLIAKDGSVQNERTLSLIYRPLRPGEIDLAPLKLLIIRGEQIDTLKVPAETITVKPEPLLSRRGWLILGLILAATATAVAFFIRWRNKKQLAALEVDPAQIEAERWRKLKSELKGSDQRRSWHGDLHDLLRDYLIRTGGNSALRTEELIAERIEREEKNGHSAQGKVELQNPTAVAWGLLKQEIVHYLYGGGIRPVHRNRETLRALQLCMELKEEELT